MLNNELSFDSEVEVWNIVSKKQVTRFDFSTFALSPDSTLIATTSHAKTLQFWEFITHKHLFTYPGYANRIQSIAWAPDGKSFAIVVDKSTIQVLRAQ